MPARRDQELKTIWGRDEKGWQFHGLGRDRKEEKGNTGWDGTDQ